MNAYELAQYLEIIKKGFTTESVCSQAAQMLRMQADEIKALREQINELQ
jgi:hypothetical protein